MSKKENEEYIYMPKSVFDAYKISQEHTLTLKEVTVLNIHKKIIKKFIEQRALSIQFEIWEWKWEWKEVLWIAIQAELAKVAGDIWNIWEVFLKHQEMEKKKQKESEDKE